MKKIRLIMMAMFMFVAVQFSTYAASSNVFDKLGLGKYVSKAAFEKAVKGYDKLGGGKLTIIDFTKPSSQKRMVIVDMKREKPLKSTYVAHGQGSGGTYATKFSNNNESHQSSLGFYRTSSTYNGKNGYSMRLQGLERGINDNAMARAIVVHGANYIGNGKTGRSWGCPAVPASELKSVISATKGGTLMYIHGNDRSYAKNSSIINS